MARHLLIPPSGDYPAGQWPAGANLPQGQHGGISMADWTSGNAGFVQQTFLGASIRSWNMKGGFGSSSSSLSVNVIIDEFNTSDKTVQGIGDDVYHNGIYDTFVPPPVGSPVFFKFGANHATIQQAWLKTLDDIYYERISPLKNPNPCNGVTTNILSTTGAVTAIPGAVDDETLLIGPPPSDHRDSTTVNYWQNRKGVNAPLGDRCRGYEHMVFGGILQSYTQNKGPSANPEYAITVNDPREILSNVSLILGNYAGTTYNNNNMFNVYGFLQHDVSDDLKDEFDSFYAKKDILQKKVDPTNGDVTFTGLDIYTSGVQPRVWTDLPEEFPITGEGFARKSGAGLPWYRVKQGIAGLFDIAAYDKLEKIGVQVATDLFPEEFVKAGYGGFVNFRGFNYIIDFRGIPLEKIPDTYYINFEQIDLLSLVQELCEVISHDFFVSLHPVIEHDYSSFWYQYNNEVIKQGSAKDIVAGIIRIDTVDRTMQPEYGAIKKYIDLLPQDLNVTNEDIGYELSNVVTEKFVVGAQETKMHYFSTNKDRDFLAVRKKENNSLHALKLAYNINPTGLLSNNPFSPSKPGVQTFSPSGNPIDFVPWLRVNQWHHEWSLWQQVLPFYGFLGEDAVSIPRGWGSYQQIQLDTTGLNAHGVGNYYIATEMELRACLLSYERWKEFLIQYNDIYLESLEEDDAVERTLLQNVNLPPGTPRQVVSISKNYGVSVPRCVFDSDVPECNEEGLPLSPSSPPYGYPLYYKRAEFLGIPEVGIARIQSSLTKLVTNYASMKTPGAREEYVKRTFQNIQRDISIEMNRINDLSNGLSQQQRDEIRKKVDEMKKRITKLEQEFDGKINEIQDFVQNNAELLKTVQRLGEKTIENSYVVYNFLKDVADKCLGKKFLVKIPQYANMSWAANAVQAQWPNQGQGVGSRVNEITAGPWGFDWSPINAEMISGIPYRYSASGIQYLNDRKKSMNNNPEQWFQHEHYLSDYRTAYVGVRNRPWSSGLMENWFASGLMTEGALKTNFNPMSDSWEYNYQPSTQGGWPDGDIYPVSLNFSDLQQTNFIPPAYKFQLLPEDPKVIQTQDYRYQCYVRFDNSQLLNFKGVSKDKYVQDVATPNGFVSDMTYHLDNTKDDEFHSFPGATEGKDRPVEEEVSTHVAFVRCSVEPRFFMPPKAIPKLVEPFAQIVVDSGTITKPRLFFDKKECKWRESYGFYTAHYIPGPSGGPSGTCLIWDYDRRDIPVPQHSFQHHAASGIVYTEPQTLDSGNVYALITIPGRVRPTIDSRFQDGPYQRFNGTLIKHYLTMDTVDAKVCGMKHPTIRKLPMRGPQLHSDLTDLCAKSSFQNVANAFAPYRAALSKLSLGTPEAFLNCTSPSPVYPNMVAIPLMSMERCYGPWLSTQLPAVFPNRKPSPELAGKVEFVKDENLAPWNYGGFTRMDEAGELRSKFSNSLLLFSERGGFSFPGLPSGVSLCSALLDGGPLVTDIAVSITDRNVTTKYQMDLYTSKFGKLDKQKEIELGKAVRERQKIVDEQNALIRKGLGKNQSSLNFEDIFDQYEGLVSLGNSSDEFTPLERKQTVSDLIVLSAKSSTNTRIAGSGTETHNKTEYGYDGSVQNVEMLKNSMSLFPTEQDAINAYQNTAAEKITDKYAPVSKDPAHPNMPTVPDMLKKKRIMNKKYYNP
jgi:hypothetical protein